jgi:hypothetical protein
MGGSAVTSINTSSNLGITLATRLGLKILRQEGHDLSARASLANRATHFGFTENWESPNATRAVRSGRRSKLPRPCLETEFRPVT